MDINMEYFPRSFLFTSYFFAAAATAAVVPRRRCLCLLVEHLRALIAIKWDCICVYLGVCVPNDILNGLHDMDADFLVRARHRETQNVDDAKSISSIYSNRTTQKFFLPTRHKLHQRTCKLYANSVQRHSSIDHDCRLLLFPLHICTAPTPPLSSRAIYLEVTFALFIDF